MTVQFWIRIICAVICALCAGFNIREYRRYGYAPQLIVGGVCVAMTAVALAAAAMTLESA